MPWMTGNTRLLTYTAILWLCSRSIVPTSIFLVVSEYLQIRLIYLLGAPGDTIYLLTAWYYPSGSCIIPGKNATEAHNALWPLRAPSPSITCHIFHSTAAPATTVPTYPLPIRNYT